MAMNPGAARRQKELGRQRKQAGKAAKKQQRKLEKQNQVQNLPPGTDPDLVGIVPGPQPPMED
jgi:hypothetical protein